MIVRFDRSKDLTIDQKLQSLASSIQLALNEIATELDKINKAIEELQEEEGE